MGERTDTVVVGSLFERAVFVGPAEADGVTPPSTARAGNSGRGAVRGIVSHTDQSASSQVGAGLAEGFTGRVDSPLTCNDATGYDAWACIGHAGCA
jgi:hypothetical protein